MCTSTAEPSDLKTKHHRNDADHLTCIKQARVRASPYPNNSYPASTFRKCCIWSNCCCFVYGGGVGYIKEI